jgi:hypothetical protein
VILLEFGKSKMIEFGKKPSIAKKADTVTKRLGKTTGASKGSSVKLKKKTKVSINPKKKKISATVKWTF